MAMACSPNCPTLRYLKQLARRDEDPAARCNEAGKELTPTTQKTTTCPLQQAADQPRG